MTDVRAFVGHSFTDDDKEVVAAFRTYFDELKGAISFTWQSAERAEPKQLAEKVIALMADKNVFIGICTKKEFAIDPKLLSEATLNKNRVKANRADFTSKTSDWIIQEIGLAIGKGLTVILLIEDGVRSPGGLQGNVEHITFERDRPEKAYPKILSMIISLLPKLAGSTATAFEPTQSADKAEEQKTGGQSDEEWQAPKPDWDQAKYEYAMFRSILRDNEEISERINKAYLNTKLASEGENTAEWQSEIERLRITFGKNRNLGKLKKLAEDHSKNVKILCDYAYGLEKYDDHAKAAVTYEAAAASAQNKATKAVMLREAAVQYRKLGNKDRLATIIAELKNAFAIREIDEETLLNQLRHIPDEKQDSDDNQLAILERLVEISPDDINTRFTLAYAHSQSGNSDSALYHYTKIPADERNSITWNNLGVALGSFRIVGKSISAFRRSEALGETLAMSNLANKFLGVGFVDEAQELCNKALGIKDYHKNVSQLLVSLKELPDEEEKKLEEAIKNAAGKVEFYREFGKGLIFKDVAEITPVWNGPDCLLAATLSLTELKLSGSYDRDSRGLYALALGVGSSGVKIRHTITYEGKFVGRSAIVTVKRDSGNMGLAATALFEGGTKALLVLNEAGTAIDIMEGVSSNSPSFYRFTALPTPLQITKAPSA